jgi:hypothetical protein
MKNILIGRIDYLNFEDGETVRSTQTIRATHSTVAKLSLYIYIKREKKRELGYSAMYSTYDSYFTDNFFVFKIQMIDLIDQNIFFI